MDDQRRLVHVRLETAAKLSEAKAYARCVRDWGLLKEDIFFHRTLYLVTRDESGRVTAEQGRHSSRATSGRKDDLERLCMHQRDRPSCR